MTILAIDPGSEITGWAEGQPDEKGDLQIVSMGILKAPKSEDTYLARCEWLTLAFDELLAKKQPDELAIEDQFVGPNAGSLIKLAKIAGAYSGVATLHRIPVFWYEPPKWKASLGAGNLDKKQVRNTLTHLGFVFPDEAPLDVSDAAGILYHHYQSVWYEELKRGEGF